MAKKRVTKPSSGLRHPDDFELGISFPGNRTYKLYLLRDGESFSTRQSTNYDHRWRGPALIYVEESPHRYVCDEYHVDDRSTWAWLGKLLSDGLPEGAHVLISRRDTQVNQAPAAPQTPAHPSADCESCKIPLTSPGLCYDCRELLPDAQVELDEFIDELQ